MDGIISVRDLGKRYHLGAQREAYHTLRESIMRGLAGGFTRRSADGARTVWALRHLNLEVAPGEVLGIIGRNGAGKSTLLKILSRITEPTEGEADLYGRVGCLLEVGTGFHSELTGRDNIFLSGAILGMRREEIISKFDAIVAFAEVEAFLDTPVKRYSSGMHMRLAFSVAAHLDPEILIIDEVLAVGDAQFQQKCLGKMGEAARQGRTILFVSHNMAAVRGLCSRALLLQDGCVVMEGDVDACVARYLANVTESGANRASIAACHRPAGLGSLVRFEGITLCADDNRAIVPAGHAIDLQLDVRISEPVSDLSLRVAVDSDEGVRVFECSSDVTAGRIVRLESGIWRLTCRIDPNILNVGRYLFALSAWSGRRLLDGLSGALAFEIARGRDRGAATREDAGLVQICASWSSPSRL
jgi:homopolymeric O-antigen transport system ATP-binding protein